MTLESNVTNGSSTITINTEDKPSGNYNIQAQLIQNNKYAQANTTRRLTIKEWDTADITPTSTEWTSTPQNDGIHSNNSYIVWKEQIPLNASILIHGTKIASQASIELRDTISNNSASLAYNCHNGIRTWGQPLGERQIGEVNWADGSFTLKIIKQANKFKFILNNDNNSTQTVILNSTILNNCYLAFLADTDGIIINDVQYHFH